MLFKKKKPTKKVVYKAPATPPFDRDMKEYQFPYSKGFRGFKRFNLIVHGNEESEKNNEKYYKNDFSNSTFMFKCFNYDAGQRVAQLFIDGHQIGAVFDDNMIYAIENGLIEKVHVEPREDFILGDKCTEVRHRITLLVKYVNPDEH